MATPADLIAAVGDDDQDRVEVLLADDPSLASARGDDGVSAVLLSRYRFQPEITSLLLAADPALDAFDAAALGDDEVLRDRLEADPSAATAYTTDGFTALHLAAFFGQPEAARRLLAAGASVGAWTRNPFANQPLHAAAAGRHLDVCRVLLGAGADVDAAQHGGYRPLHEAAEHGDEPMVDLFLDAGADVTATDDDGRTAADLAARAGHEALAARLRGLASA